MLTSTLPLAGLTLSFAAWSATTVNTASITAPAGTFEANTANNMAVDTNTLLAVLAAADDAATGINGGAGAANVINAFAGDTINGAAAGPAAATLALAAGATLPSGILFDTASGNVSVSPGTDAGTYAFDYTLCETANPANCDTATITLTVNAAPISADPDAVSGIVGKRGQSAALDVLPGDLLGGSQVSLNQVTIALVTPARSRSSGLPVPLLNTATWSIDVPAGNPASTYALTYRICEQADPANCATSTATVEVIAAPITAAPDKPAPVGGAVGAQDTVNAFANDRLDGAPVDPAGITAAVTSPAQSIGGGSVPVLDPATGLVDVPPGTPEGTYTIGYRICETLNPDNCADSTVTVIVTAAAPGTLMGTVYLDNNGDRTFDAGDAGRGGWIIEVLSGTTLVATTTTDAQGDYAVPGLTVGADYAVRFRNPENRVVYSTITGIAINTNQTVVDQDLPIDPSGVVYDSITRQPLANVTLSLVDANGTPLPGSCFVDPSQQNQRTGASGFYRFDLSPGGSAQCPAGATEYRIALGPPAGFSGPSTVLAPQAGPLDPPGGILPYRVAPNPGPPSDAAPVYYLAFRLQAGDADVVNNHIPIDPFLTRTPLIVTKTSTRRSASTGDIVPYEITVRNAETSQRAGVDVVDILPPGMKYVAGSAAINGVAAEPVSANDGRELIWRGQIIPAGGWVRYNLALVVGAGVAAGERVNTGVAEQALTGTEISNRATATVSIIPSSVFDCSELLGKVFEDRNRDGYQDEGEPGVAGVRLATVNGELITTDQHGRYHVACASVPNASIGSNFVLKLDPRTLPLGWVPTTENPRSIRLTRGKAGELNFGVAPAPADSPAAQGEK